MSGASSEEGELLGGRLEVVLEPPTRALSPLPEPASSLLPRAQGLATGEALGVGDNLAAGVQSSSLSLSVSSNTCPSANTDTLTKD